MPAKTVEELEAEVKALTAKIARASAHADDDDPGDRGSIPAARFAQHRAQLRELQALASDLQQQLGKTAAEIKTSADKAIKAARDEHAAALAAESRRASVDLDLSDLGVKDPTIRRLVREHFDASDEKARGESPAAWLRARREAAAKAAADSKSAAPDAIPWLDAYEAHVSSAGKPSQDQPRGRRVPVNTDAGAGGNDGDGYTMDDISRMSPAALAKYAGIPMPKTDA